MKKYVVLLAVVLLFASVVIANAQNLDVDLVCPEIVFSGDPLDVRARVYNNNCYVDVIVSKAIVALGGNSNGTLGAMGLFGPYPRRWGNYRIIEAAQCNQYGQVIRPGQRTFSLNIVSSVPASMENTMVVATVGFMQPDRSMIGGNTCIVEVAPFFN